MTFLTDPLVSAFAAAYTNRALPDEHAFRIAGHLLDRHGLPRHEDACKDWDLLLALFHAARHAPKGTWVLDAGCNFPSQYLQGLYALDLGLGLTGAGLSVPGNAVVDNYCYDHQDITATRYSARQYSFIACLSVIEHGVELPKFFAEMSRILRPGGHLFVSFDYWETPVDTGGREAFGVPVKVFTPADVDFMMMRAFDHDLRVKSPLDPLGDVIHLQTIFDPTCHQRAVHWLGLDYTFANLLLRKS